MDIVDASETVIGPAPAPRIAVVPTTDPASAARASKPPSPAMTRSCDVRTRIKSPQTNGVVERFFGTLKYEHLYRGYISDADALDMEVHRFRIIYNTIRPHQAPYDQTRGRPRPTTPKQQTKTCQLIDSHYESTD